MGSKGKLSPSIDLNATYKSNSYGDFTIDKYEGATQVTIKFLNTGGSKLTSVSSIKNGNVRDDVAPNVFGIGYTDISTDTVDGVSCKAYNVWYSILSRCYSEAVHKTHPSYRDCTISDEWKYYSKFKVWYDRYYKVGCSLDKDILCKGNKIYSDNTCCFVPTKINNLILKRERDRGSYPIGVSILEGKYGVSCNNIQGKSAYLGYYDTTEEAFQVYKVYKEALIKRVAGEYFNNGKITLSVYNALLEYKVSITD